MVGPRLWQVKPCGSNELYGAAGRQVHPFAGAKIALCFVWLKGFTPMRRRERGRLEGHSFPLRKFTAEPPNAFLLVRCLLSMSVAFYRHWEARPGFRGRSSSEWRLALNRGVT
jgi:hypothetical protein